MKAALARGHRRSPRDPPAGAHAQVEGDLGRNAGRAAGARARGGQRERGRARQRRRLERAAAGLHASLPVHAQQPARRRDEHGVGCDRRVPSSTPRAESAPMARAQVGAWARAPHAATAHATAASVVATRLAMRGGLRASGDSKRSSLRPHHRMTAPASARPRPMSPRRPRATGSACRSPSPRRAAPRRATCARSWTRRPRSSPPPR